METSISGANHAVLLSQIYRRNLGHMEIYNSEPKVAVWYA